MPDTSPLSRGWEIVRTLNNSVPTISSIEARKLLAEYVKLMQLPASLGDNASIRQLHSAILSVAVKMAQAYTDFRFVPFLNLWGIENLRPEDSESGVDSQGKRFPSLVERMAKSYAYSLLFHPDDHLESELEALLIPHLQRKGFVLSSQSEGITHHLLATNTFTTEVRGRKMTFVNLISPDGTELSAEVHTLTAHAPLRYSEISGKMFSVLLRTSEKGNLRIEAAILSSQPVSDVFPTSIGYIENIDLNHRHIHVFDNQSRHLVAMMDAASNVVIGSFVQFLPIIPKESKFKSAIILRTLSDEEGPEAFGYRKARVTYVDNDKGYLSWELLPGEPPIIETGTTAPSYTKGYLNLQSTNTHHLTPNTEFSLIVYLKRGKDGQKRPHVVKVKTN